MAIVLNHAVGIHAKTGLASGRFLEVRKDVHTRRVPPDKEWLVLFLRTLHEVERLDHDLIINRFHSFTCQRTRIVDRTAGKTVDDTTRTKFLLKLWIFRIVRVLWLFFCVQMI